MTYHELVEEVKNSASRMDPARLTDHVAIQVNIEGEAEGAFYIQLMQGNIVVMPYEYYDRDVLLICQATHMLAILNGDMDPMQALADGQIRAEGNIGRLALFGEIIKKVPMKKASRKTRTDKKEAKTGESAVKKSTGRKR